MRTFSTVSEMYRCFTHEADPERATQLGQAIWLRDSADRGVGRHADKVRTLARQMPQPAFAEFVASIVPAATHGRRLGRRDAAPPPLDARVLSQQTVRDQLRRRIDVLGRTLGQVCVYLAAQQQVDAPVLARVLPRLAQQTATSKESKHLKKYVDALIREHAPEVVEKVVVWLSYTGAKVVPEEIFLGLTEVEKGLTGARQAKRSLPARSRREVLAAADARPLLKFLACVHPDLVPGFESDPQLEEHLLCWLHFDWLAAHDADMTHLRQAQKILELLERHNVEGDRAIEALDWSALDKQAARALCGLTLEINRAMFAWLARGEALAYEEQLARLDRKIDKMQGLAAPDEAGLTALWVERARVLDVHHRRYEDALADLQRVVDKRPNPETLYEQSLTLANLGRYEEAERAVTRAEQLLRQAAASEVPEDFPWLKVYTLRTDLRLRLERPLEALADMLKVRLLTVGSPYTELHEDLELMLNAAWQKELAQVSGRAPAQFSLWLALQQARALLVPPDFSAAQAAYRSIAERHPQLPEAQLGIEVAADLEDFYQSMPPDDDGGDIAELASSDPERLAALLGESDPPPPLETIPEEPPSPAGSAAAAGSSRSPAVPADTAAGVAAGAAAGVAAGAAAGVAAGAAAGVAAGAAAGVAAGAAAGVAAGAAAGAAASRGLDRPSLVSPAAPGSTAGAAAGRGLGRPSLVSPAAPGSTAGAAAGRGLGRPSLVSPAALGSATGAAGAAPGHRLGVSAATGPNSAAAASAAVATRSAVAAAALAAPADGAVASRSAGVADIPAGVTPPHPSGSGAASDPRPVGQLGKREPPPGPPAPSSAPRPRLSWHRRAQPDAVEPAITPVRVVQSGVATTAAPPPPPQPEVAAVVPPPPAPSKAPSPKVGAAPPRVMPLRVSRRPLLRHAPFDRRNPTS